MLSGAMPRPRTTRAWTSRRAKLAKSAEFYAMTRENARANPGAEARMVTSSTQNASRK